MYASSNGYFQVGINIYTVQTLTYVVMLCQYLSSLTPDPHIKIIIFGVEQIHTVNNVNYFLWVDDGIE